MKIRFERSFTKDLSEQLDEREKRRVQEAIENIEAAPSLYQIKNLEKLKGFKTFFRIRVGSYRIGFELVRDTIVLVAYGQRGFIYKKFP
jgi:mRNA interferase RelE/StbE